MVVANKFSFGKQDFKYFICYKDDRKIIPLFIFCPEMTIYIEKTLIKLNVCIF